MWVIFKIKKNEKGLFKKDLLNKLDEKIVFYSPKILTKKSFKNKTVNNAVDILGDYVLCHHKNFLKKDVLNLVKYCRGLKYLLSNCINSQKEIKAFIENCKKFENKEGFLSYKFFSAEVNKNYEIISGPFFGQVAKILNDQKNKVNLLLGNIKASIDKKSFLFKSV
jgi:hypothetical protein